MAPVIHPKEEDSRRGGSRRRQWSQRDTRGLAAMKNTGEASAAVTKEDITRRQVGGLPTPPRADPLAPGHGEGAVRGREAESGGAALRTRQEGNRQEGNRQEDVATSDEESEIESELEDEVDSEDDVDEPRLGNAMEVEDDNSADDLAEDNSDDDEAAVIADKPAPEVAAPDFAGPTARPAGPGLPPLSLLPLLPTLTERPEPVALPTIASMSPLSPSLAPQRTTPVAENPQLLRPSTTLTFASMMTTTPLQELATLSLLSQPRKGVGETSTLASLTPLTTVPLAFETSAPTPTVSADMNRNTDADVDMNGGRDRDGPPDGRRGRPPGALDPVAEHALISVGSIGKRHLTRRRAGAGPLLTPVSRRLHPRLLRCLDGMAHGEEVQEEEERRLRQQGPTTAQPFPREVTLRRTQPKGVA